MKEFTATTASGTEYRHDGSPGVKITPGPNGYGYPTVIRGHMVVVPPEKIATWINENEGRIDWEWIRNAPSAEVPVVGAHLFVSGLSEWRLSTPIVKVEEK